MPLRDRRLVVEPPCSRRRVPTQLTRDHRRRPGAHHYTLNPEEPVYPIDLGDAKRGHEQRGRRLGLVISIEDDAWSMVTVLPTSTSAQASVFRPEVVIAGRETKILIDQVRTIDVSYVAGDLVDYLTRDDIAQVERSLSRYFGLLR
jgi:mRNA interferase MazF